MPQILTKPHQAFLLAICSLLMLGASAERSIVKQDSSLKTMHILAFGDSLTAGYRLNPSQSFAARLEAALIRQGRHVRVTNAGVSGDTTTGGRSRLAWSLADKPDLVILELGANDALRGIDPAITKANLAAMIETCLDHKTRVLLCGITPPGNFGPDYARRFAAMFTDLAGQFDVPLYPDFLKGVLGNPALTLDDGLHPSPAGVDIIVAGIVPMIIDILTLTPKTALPLLLDHRPATI